MPPPTPRQPCPIARSPGGQRARSAGLDSGAIELTGATHSSELLNRSPGAMIQHGSGQESLTALRSPVLTGAGACGAVLLLGDGHPIRPAGIPPAAVERSREIAPAPGR